MFRKGTQLGRADVTRSTPASLPGIGQARYGRAAGHDPMLAALARGQGWGCHVSCCMSAAARGMAQMVHLVGGGAPPMQGSRRRSSQRQRRYNPLGRVEREYRLRDSRREGDEGADPRCRWGSVQVSTAVKWNACGKGEGGHLHSGAPSRRSSPASRRERTYSSESATRWLYVASIWPTDVPMMGER